MTKHFGMCAFSGAVGLVLTVACGAAWAQLGGLEITFEAMADPQAAVPPGEGGFPLQLVLDDGTAEGTIGVNSATAQQFLWFNQFTPDLSPPFQLEEIHVLFPPGVNMTVGDAVDLVVYVDPDADPTNGADLLAVIPETIQILDGRTFSVYPLSSPLIIEDPGDVLIGVISRFVQSGVDPPTSPAALDTTASQSRSWIAVWTGDPPASPDLPPDSVLDPIDVIFPGNWMIRGFGEPSAVPTMPYQALAALSVLLLLAGTLLLRWRTSRS